MTEDTEAETDEVTGEIISGTAVPDQNTSSKKRPNAFTELMSKKPKPTTPSPSKPKPKSFFPGRDGLNAYIQHPGSFPPDRVISHSSSFVLISDLFPKSTVHLLLLPRDQSISSLHPFEALSDPAFLSLVRTEVLAAVKVASSSLRQHFSSFSALDAPRRTALALPDPPDELPEGREWSSEIKIGVHAHPSMSNLHIHIISKDMHSSAMKNAKHYQSFNTEFFIPLTDFPLAEGDPRRHPGREGYLGSEMRCWRCGKGFGREFKRLKQHLAEEVEEWKRL